MPERIAENFIKNYLKNDFSVRKLAGDASNRIYYRIITDEKSYVLCYDSAFKTENPEQYPFLKIQKIFSGTGINVPEVYSFDSESGLILQSDNGDDLLFNIIEKASSENKIDLYKTAIDELVKIQSVSGSRSEIPFSISFDIEKLMYEFNFFIENTLKLHYGFNTCSDLKKLNDCFADTCAILFKPELFVLCHRDYHSRNILFDQNKPVVIDFQDARMGLPQYDIASLLRDSYISLSESDHGVLLNYYHILSLERKLHNMSSEEFNYYYDIMSFQRNIKAAGSFGYLTHVKKMSSYEKYIESTLRSASVYSLKRPELAHAMNIILNAAGII